LVGAVIALSLVVIVGFIGQISLAQVAIAGLAAMFLTNLCSKQFGLGFPWAPLLATAIATAVSTIVLGIPSLRARGVTLAVITLAIAYAAEMGPYNDPRIAAGSGAGARADNPSLFGIDFGVNSSFLGETKIPNPGFGLFLVVILTVLCLATVNLRRSVTGQRMLAVRSNERAAAAAGVNVVGTKLVAFAMSSFIAAVGGTLIVYKGGGTFTGAEFLAMLSLTALATAYLGGITSVSGALLAGALVVGGLSPHVMDDVFEAGRYENLISGFGLLLAAIINQEGMSGALRQSLRRSPRVREDEPVVVDEPVVSEVGVG
jgi:ABC-type branched-subunit amino acid transport system permease subunit